MITPSRNDILLIALEENSAWERICRGYFITLDGRKHNFDFSDEPQKADNPLPNIFNEPRTNTDIMFNKDTVNSVLRHIQALPEKLDFEDSKSVSCDMGTTTYFAIKEKNKGTFCMEILICGDTDWIPMNQDAIDIISILKTSITK